MKIITTGITKPPTITIYGAPGVGKSRLAASFPRPIFLRTEDRHDHLTIQATDGIIDTWARLIGDLQMLLTEDHDRKTVIIDTLDSAEHLTASEVCRGSGTNDILHPKIFPFYSGYAKCGILWETEILPLMRALNEEKKMIPVFISHFKTEYVEHPEYGSYPKYVLGVDKRIANKIFKFCDIVGFLDWKTTATEGTTTKLLSSTGKRVLRLKPKPIWETKESYNLPDSLDIPEDKPGELLGYSVLRAAIVKGIKERATSNLGEVKADRDTEKLTKVAPVKASSVEDPKLAARIANLKGA